jgi:hypothetical protein
VFCHDPHRRIAIHGQTLIRSAAARNRPALPVDGRAQLDLRRRAHDLESLCVISLTGVPTRAGVGCYVFRRKMKFHGAA